MCAVPDLPLCLGVLKHRASLARGPRWPGGLIFLPKIAYDGVLLLWCNFKFEGVLFRSDSRHNGRVDSLLECATKQAVMTVAQWHRNQIIRGLWLLAKKRVEDRFMLTWCNFEFDGVLFNLDTCKM
jgi:hypothetical protein